MTREEITKEAQEQVNYCTPLHPEDFIHGYIAGAYPREKRITELKSIAEFQQSSNMKRHFEIQKLEKENKELADENEALKFAARMSEKTEKQLRAEIEEFKETKCRFWL